jgi:hypothetical protein
MKELEIQPERILEHFQKLQNSWNQTTVSKGDFQNRQSQQWVNYTVCIAGLASENNDRLKQSTLFPTNVTHSTPVSTKIKH